MHPFDFAQVFLAKHAQHVVLIHFPIALFITGVAFDLIGRWRKDAKLAAAAYFNFTVAALSTVPVVATGLLAWQFQLEGQRLKGVLLWHLLFASASTVWLWVAWLLHFRARKTTETPSPRLSLSFELIGVAVIAVTGHLGGFLSGVNGPG